MNIRRVSAWVLWLQLILFALSTFYVIWGFIQVIGAGAGFYPAFESIQLRRLIPSLAFYLILPVSIIFCFLLHRSAKYGVAVCSPLLLVGFAFIAGRLYLEAVPDPIVENFGPRPAPYPGFLVLPAERVPAGFQETRHHYTKREYTVHFTKLLNGKRIDLDIVESDLTTFVHKRLELVREFTYQAIIGQVYTSYDDEVQKHTLNLIWLNPPKQRISIYLTQTPGNDYSPEDLIEILASMKGV